MLSVENLSKRYRGITVVDQVSFSIARGEILGYLGPNGAGKTTTMKMIVGLIDPSDGHIFFDGQNVFTDMKGFQRRLGYVSEEAHLYGHLTGCEYLLMAGRLRGMARKPLIEKSDEFLKLLGIWEDRHSLVASYSKGMRQKILLSSALMHNPEFLVLDEPFSGLDVNAAIVLRSLLRALAERGKAILYSSHALEVVEKVAHRVLILHRGEVVAHDSVSALRDMASQASLEGVFAQLTAAQNADVIAGRILEVASS
ncbi:MAG: ABC transporter ATP-binding protein [Bryobacteraceae bacterium]|nr:ABC transporter ATP-binding protein [Bryobacteraceae bacterium]